MFYLDIFQFVNWFRKFIIQIYLLKFKKLKNLQKLYVIEYFVYLI